MIPYGWFHVLWKYNCKQMRNILLIIVAIAFAFSACTQSEETQIDLSGTWQFSMDPEDIGISEKWYDKTFSESVSLPGSMVENDKGIPVDYDTKWLGNLRNKIWYDDENYKPYFEKGEFLFPYWLIPDKHYYGAAWYQKTVEIPSSWNSENIELYLERCHWETQVWVDETKVGKQNSLGTAHRYKLGKLLTPGKHKITICVDNRVKDLDVGPDSHSVSDHTQSNWNGIVGEIKLVNKAKLSIADVQIYPDVKTKSADIKIKLKDIAGIKGSATVEVQAVSVLSKEAQYLDIIKIEIDNLSDEITINYPMGDDVQLWDEFNPNLYKLTVTVKSETGTDTEEVQFGMREFEINETQFAINGRSLFLRGTLECCIFPKTGYPPTEVAEWKRIIEVCRAHGLNHIRFHSWCPPKAAFIAADELGFYYQVECSSWANSTSSVGDGKVIDSWLYEESERMIKDYGNHPSFCLMAYGNEPGGKNQVNYLGNLVKHWKSQDKRRVYTGGAGWPVLDENDYHNLPGPRIQGWGEQLGSIINAEAPRTNYDWSNKLGANDRPVVSHEIGQWCVFPNFKEIEKYDGVLKAKNFELFKRSLEVHKMGHLADSFLIASGKLQALCYKADIEAALRTKGFGGFQLLDLHDFPGQGTALVGVLDPFWEEKGYISPEEFSRFCNETVPLARFEKRIFRSDEIISVDIEVAHFGEKEIEAVSPSWKLLDENGSIVQNGNLPIAHINWGNGIELGNISLKYQSATAKQLTLEVDVAGFSNSWDIWVYPSQREELKEEIFVVQELNEKAMSILKNGGKVLLSTKKGSIKPEAGGDIGVGFSSIFWNTAWTGGQKPHTLGILCNPQHPALAEFPSEFHSNWQWWDAMSHSNAIKLEGFSKPIQPIVRVIDDWVSNRQLALVFEAKVGNGKLIFSGIDLIDNQENRPEAQQLLYSLKKYMDSDDFDPTVELEVHEFSGLIQ